MSKELTEQWRNGTLKTGSYYIITILGNEKSDYFEGKRFCFWSDYEIDEVLASVPTYEEWKAAYECQLMESEEVLTLKQQLKEAEKVIKFYANTDQLTDEEKQMTGEKYHLVYGLKAIEYLEKWRFVK